jgi:myo-inositol 2-dehydrogenase/D-chiro-inositol 1-dehydrogenase
MGTRHVENLSRFVRAAQVSAVYDLDGQRAAQAADIAGGAAVLNDPYALIRSPQVQAVLIASPDSTHLEFVLACLQEKKPVLCEKPLAVSAADAERILQAELLRAALGFVAYAPFVRSMWRQAAGDSGRWPKNCLQRRTSQRCHSYS